MVLQIADYFRKLSRKEQGFTLIELVIVVAIIAILIAVAIPIYQNVTRSAAQRSHDTNLRTIDSAVSQYFMAKGKYPTKMDDLLGSGEDSYLKEKPEIPSLLQSSEYLVGYTSGTMEYDISPVNDEGTVQPWAEPLGIGWDGYRQEKTTTGT